MKKTKPVLFYLSIVITICAVNYAIKMTHPLTKANDPIYYRSGMCVINLFFSGYLLYSWKSNMSELLKRASVAIPFALILLILAIILGYRNFGVVGSVLFIYILLLFKTPNWKKHFCAILMPAFILIILFRFLWVPVLNLDWSTEWVFLRVVLSFCCFMPVLSFSLLYLSKLESGETPNFRAILIRSVKYSITVSLFFAIYFGLTDISDRKEINSLITVLMSSLLAISFVTICYIFDLGLVERKGKSKKKNKLSKLENELNNFYLEKRAKAKREQ